MLVRQGSTTFLACLLGCIISMSGCPSGSGTGQPALIVSVDEIHMGKDKESATFFVKNVFGARDLPEATLMSIDDWVLVSPAHGAVAAGEPLEVTVQVDREKLGALSGMGTIFVSAPAVPTRTVDVYAEANIAADFWLSSELVNVGEKITFVDVSQVSDGQPGVSSWEWDFGDGTTVTGKSAPRHHYLQSGVYTVRLRVSNGVHQAQATKSGIVTVL